jgi:hypothetical protein
MFPVLQYFTGTGKIIFPPEVKTDDLKAKP